MPRALESGLSERGREDSERGRKTFKGMLPEDIEIRASLQSMF